MRRVKANSWYRWWTPAVLPILLLVVIGMVVLLACNPMSPQEPAAPSTSMWVTLKSAVRDPGPYTYTTREPITLADGSQVVCVASLDAMWCKEAK